MRPVYGIAMRTTLPLRAKKMIGLFLILALIFIYAIVAVTIAGATLATAPWYAHALYFALTGVLWVVPAAIIIKWMVTET